MKKTVLKSKLLIAFVLVPITWMDVNGQVGEIIDDVTGRIYCRCKDKGCYSGNMISLRPACYKGELGENVQCTEHAENNCKNYEPTVDEEIIFE